MNTELIAPIVTGVGVLSFATIFTVLYRSYAHSAVTEYESGQMDVELIDETVTTNIKDSKGYRKVLRRVKQGLTIGLVALLIPFMLLSIYSKFTDGVTMIGGKGMIAVASGSMSEKNEANPYLANINNQFNTYDMITLQKVESPGELNVYDVIAYINDEGINVIHRIVAIQNTTSGPRYVTRGDSNNADDEYKPSMDDIIGKYTGTRIPYVGMFIMFLQSVSGILTIAAVIYCLIMIESAANKIYVAREDRLEILQKAINFETDTVMDEKLDALFIETVYYKNYAYTFDDNGFISKTRISELNNAQDFNSEPADSADTESADGNGDGEKL